METALAHRIRLECSAVVIKHLHPTRRAAAPAVAPVRDAQHTVQAGRAHAVDPATIETEQRTATRVHRARRRGRGRATLWEGRLSLVVVAKGGRPKCGQHFRKRRHPHRRLRLHGVRGVRGVRGGAEGAERRVGDQLAAFKGEHLQLRQRKKQHGGGVVDEIREPPHVDIRERGAAEQTADRRRRRRRRCRRRCRRRRARMLCCETLDLIVNLVSTSVEVEHAQRGAAAAESAQEHDRIHGRAAAQLQVLEGRAAQDEVHEARRTQSGAPREIEQHESGALRRERLDRLLVEPIALREPHTAERRAVLRDRLERGRLKVVIP